MESGNAQVLIQKVNLQETLNAVIHLIQTTQVTVEKRLKVVTQYDPLLPEFIHSDSRRIQQILYNLLGNGIKFSQEESIVEFGVKLFSDSNTVQFKVKDYGKGIESADFDKIFEPFRQTETGLSNATAGTGLGLAITKKLVHAMGGEIFVDSVFGSWTQFTVNFPIKTTDFPANINDLSQRLSRANILFVADHLDSDTQRIEALFDYFNVDYAQYDDMISLNQALVSKNGPFATYRDAYIVLVHEDVCDLGIFELLAAKVPSYLTTFGPRFSIERKTKKHWRSLVETFPSVLIDTLGYMAQDLIQANDQNGMSLRSTNMNISPWETLRILIAEDNLVNQKVMTRILNRLGVTLIDLAGNGLEAVEMEAKRPYDLVLMDMQMPKMVSDDVGRREVSILFLKNSLNFRTESRPAKKYTSGYQ